ncbi:MAG: LytTR family DNA-binding domain-containing protein [Sphingomonadaceae bacterium]
MTSYDQRLQRYLTHKRLFEAGFWILFLLGEAAANSITAWLDLQRSGTASVEFWQVLTWEFSSNIVVLLLIPALLTAVRHWPLHWGMLRRNLLRHAGCAILFSLIHTGLMVGIRKLVYASQGLTYDFGNWPVELTYEAIKDVRAYALLLACILGYRLLIWRLQGEATLLQAPDQAFNSATVMPALDSEAATPPERFLVKKLGKEFLLPTKEIEWIQASGNYVNLHRLGHDYPLRSTLAKLEARLATGFMRVHRSYLVNLALIVAIEPTEFGDARLRTSTGASVPCSRTYLEELRQRLQSSRD